MATNRGLIKDVLLPTLHLVNGKYEPYPAQYKQFFEERTSNQASERMVQMQYTGLLSVKAEGEAMSQDPGMIEKYLTQVYMVPYGNSFTMTHEAIQDNLYKDQFPQGVKSLKDGASCTMNTVAGLFMVNGFVNTVGDGQPMFSANHPYNGGVFSNTLNAGLNETSLSVVNVLAQNFKDDAGLQMVTKLKTLVVDANNEFQAERLTKSRFQAETANNAINAVKSLGLFSNGYAVNNFINLANAANPNWFVTTNHGGLIMFIREKEKFDVSTDAIGTTLNVVTSIYQRYAPCCYDFRGCIGAQGA